MAYRKPQRYFSFADLAVEKHADKYRALALLKQLNRTIDWKQIDKLLSKSYHTGKSAEGGKAIRSCCCLSACCFKSGSRSLPILI